MIPSNDLVLRRRHLILIAIRVAATFIIVYGLVDCTQNLIEGLYQISISNAQTIIEYLQLGIAVMYVVPGLALGAASRPLARWIVPPGLSTDACPSCGYSLRNLKAPICPECGADVRPISPHANP